MITGADDYPFHQTPDPMAFAGTDRNFYDRFFFNGYTPDGEVFFAVAFGLYPQLDVMDGAFCILKDGKQHNVRVSRKMNADRSMLAVGPLSIEIVNPLKETRIRLADNDSGIVCDLICHARHEPIEEPRFTRRIGTRAFMDYTRLTQNVSWSGEIRVDGETIRFDASEVFGTRDRSWGVRPVGSADSQPPREGSLTQFYWLWTPCNFENAVAFSHTNDDEYGRPWNRRAGTQIIGDPLREYDEVEYRYEWSPNTRLIASLIADMSSEDGRAELKFTPFKTFYMTGLGYGHPQWGHGKDQGDDAFAYDVMEAEACTPFDPLCLHIQALAKTELTIDGETHSGIGVVEQFFVGRHDRTGMLDGLAVLPEGER